MHLQRIRTRLSCKHGVKEIQLRILLYLTHIHLILHRCVIRLEIIISCYTCTNLNICIFFHKLQMLLLLILLITHRQQKLNMHRRVICKLHLNKHLLLLTLWNLRLQIQNLNTRSLVHFVLIEVNIIRNVQNRLQRIKILKQLLILLRIDVNLIHNLKLLRILQIN